MKAPADCQTIDEVRSEIDRIDAAILQALAERQAYVRAIMRFKQTETDVRAPQRQQSVLQSRRRQAQALGLDPALVEDLFRRLIDHFVQAELALLSDKES